MKPDIFIKNNIRDIYIARYHNGAVLPGTARRIMTPEGAFTHPAMSPDGSRVAFWGICEGRIDVWTADAASCEAERLTGGAGSNCHPSWSPDSGRIVFASDPSHVFTPGESGLFGSGRGFGRRSLWVADIKTGSRAQLSRGEEDYERPAWSPLGGEIAFVRSPGEQKDIYILDICSGRKRAVTGGGGVFYRPAWHPSGRLISFNNKGPGSHYIWIADSEGGKPRRVTHGDVHGGTVRDHGSFWFCGGKKLIFHSNRSGTPGIWALELKTGRINRVPVPGFTGCGHATMDAAESLMSFDSERRG